MALWHHMETYIWVSMGSGNDPNDTTSSHEPIWLRIIEVLWHSPESNCTATILYNDFENYVFKIIAAAANPIEWDTDNAFI